MFFILILIILLAIGSVSAENISDVKNTSVDDVILDTYDASIFEKGYSYNATLSDINNNALPNRSLIFTLNGVNYTKITNSEGVGSLSINLETGVYPVSVSFTDSSGNRLVNNNTLYVSDIKGTVITGEMTNAQIQSVLDSANDGDTIIFQASSYENISLVVSKHPLNIISIMKSTLTGNGITPVFTLTASGTNISNLAISNGLYAVHINGADNVGISNNNLEGNVNGIKVENANNANIFNNTILNSQNNSIHILNSQNTNITYNYINNTNEGIYFDSNVGNTNVEYNFITQAKDYAVYLDKSGADTSIQYNIISRNENGINVDCNGDENLIINYNTIEWSSNVGLNFGENYRKTNENRIADISFNSILYNSNFNILGRYSIYNSLPIGDNWIAATNPTQTRVCEKIKFNKIALNVEQKDANTLLLSVDGIVTPFDFRVSYDGGATRQLVTFNDGKATIHVANDDGNVVMQYYGDYTAYRYQLSNYTPYVASNLPETPKETPKENSRTNSTVPNQQTARSMPAQASFGISDSGNAVSGADISQTITGTDSIATQKDSQSESAGSPAGEQSHSVVKSINLDGEDTVKVSGIGLILLVIIAIIGLYYGRDIKFMLNQRNEH